MSKIYHMIVAMGGNYSHVDRDKKTPEEVRFQQFVDFRTRNNGIAVEKSMTDAALLKSNDRSFLVHKADVFNLHGYKARILRGNELQEFYASNDFFNSSNAPQQKHS